jgi:hypothetical protein
MVNAIKDLMFNGGDYEECRLLGYKNPVRTSQETHYVSATEPNRLLLCKIWGFHGGNYEEHHLLGYENLVPTSQETYYVSATDPSRLMLYKIRGFHDDDYKECRIFGMLYGVALVITDVSETLYSSETSVLTRATLTSQKTAFFIEDTMFQKLNLFPSTGEKRETSTLLGLLERANLNHWTVNC